MTAKFRMKVRGVEIDWEGEASFLKSDIANIVSKIVEAVSVLPDEPSDSGAASGKLSGAKFTTNSLASKTKPDSGSTLFLTALGKLQLSDGIEPAARSKIHDEMKMVSSVYKANMLGNLSKIIKQLMDNGSINEPTSGHYALSPTKLAEIQTLAS